MAFKPLYNNVLIKRVDQEERTSGGIYIPDTAKEKPMQGTVVSCGEGMKNDNGTTTAMSVKEGDTVLFNKWSGTEVKIENEEYLIMKETDILGIMV